MAEAFTQQGARARGLVVGLSLMLLVESVAIHAFLLGKPWWIHALLLAANASTIWFLVAHDRAIGTRPVLVDDAGIEVRHGMLIAATVPWAKVGAVTTQFSRDRCRGGKTLPSAVRRGYTSRMLDWNDCPAVERIPGKVSGEWLFRSTRVPVRALFENLEGGASVAEFLEWFPGVTREQVDAVLEHTSRSLAVSA